MATLTATMAALAVLVIFPLLILWRLSLTPRQNARRMHTTARRYCLA